MKKELLKGLTEEQIAKVRTCNNTDEILVLSKQEGLELTSEQLEAVNGGACSNTDNCPPCPSRGSTNGDILPPLIEVGASCSMTLTDQA